VVVVLVIEGSIVDFSSSMLWFCCCWFILMAMVLFDLSFVLWNGDVKRVKREGDIWSGKGLFTHEEVLGTRSRQPRLRSFLRKIHQQNPKCDQQVR